MIKSNFTEKQISKLPLFNSFVKELKANEAFLKIENSYLYYDFPVYKDFDGELIIAKLLLVSENQGVTLFRVTDIINENELASELNIYSEDLLNLYSVLYSRFLRNSDLRKSKNELLFPINLIIYAPNIKKEIKFENQNGIVLVFNIAQLESHFDIFLDSRINSIIFQELISTIEGAKGIRKITLREKATTNSKGAIVNSLEKEIASFDEYQKIAYSSQMDGVNRIRGLAGSGKTVVLAIKAALTHLKYPEAKIAYTFYTKSLYQHIK